MHIALQLLFPIVIYVIYCIFDGLHTVALLRPPGVDIETKWSIHNTINFFENRLFFLHDYKKFGHALLRDLALLDWFWPWHRFKGYILDDSFKQAYTKGNTRWLILKICSWFTLLASFIMFTMFRNNIFDTTAISGYTIVTCVSIVWFLGIYKYVGRLFYRVFFMIALEIALMTKSVIKALKTVVPDISNKIFTLYHKSKLKTLPGSVLHQSIRDTFVDPVDKDERVLEKMFTDYVSAVIDDRISVNHEYTFEDVKNTLQEINNTVTRNERMKISNDYADMFIGKSGDLQMLSQELYDYKLSPLTSIFRFLVFENKGSQLMILLVIVAYLVAGGYSLGTRIIGNEDDNDDDDANPTSVIIKNTLFLTKVSLVALVYITLYAIALATVRQVGLYLLSYFGRQSKDIYGNVIPSIGSYIANEIMTFSHQFKVPEEITIWKPLKKASKYIALHAFVIVVLALLMIFTYLVLTYRNNDADESRSNVIHYIEANKTLAIITSICICLYTFMKTP